jgi:hypothetical protein
MLNGEDSSFPLSNAAIILLMFSKNKVQSKLGIEMFCDDVETDWKQVEEELDTGCKVWPNSWLDSELPVPIPVARTPSRRQSRARERGFETILVGRHPSISEVLLPSAV